MIAVTYERIWPGYEWRIWKYSGSDPQPRLVAHGWAWRKRNVSKAAAKWILKSHMKTEEQ